MVPLKAEALALVAWGPRGRETQSREGGTTGCQWLRVLRYQRSSFGEKRERERERERGGGRERIAFPQKASLTDLCAMLPFMFVWFGLGVLSSLPSSFFLPQRDSLSLPFPEAPSIFFGHTFEGLFFCGWGDAISTIRKNGSNGSNSGLDGGSSKYPRNLIEK